jgi:hypothetical protein
MKIHCKGFHTCALMITVKILMKKGSDQNVVMICNSPYGNRQACKDLRNFPFKM